MKLTLTQDLVFKMSLDKAPIFGSKPQAFEPVDGPNYLVIDDHRESPPGFAARVGKRSTTYLVDKVVAGKRMKIHVGLARGRKGSEKPISLADARQRAWELLQVAKKHGANPRSVDEQIEASELTLGQVFDQYESYLKSRAQPAKRHSFDSLAQGRRKLKDWEERKVRLISAGEILDRFDHHAVALKHRTSAEAMGRWATTAVDKAIEREIHDAHAAGRAPSLTYNPFTILRTEDRYRTNQQLEREYQAKGVRNPLSFTDTVGKYVDAAWRYRRSNALAGDFILLTMLWGNRRGESATFKWRDQVSDAEAPSERWIDDKLGVGHVGDAKNRGDHEFPIGPLAMQLLKLRRAEQGEGQIWVFPARSPRSDRGCYTDPTHAMKTVKEMAEVKQARGHDLRRTFGAACEKLGFSDRQTKRMLGHSTGTGDSVNRYTAPEWLDIADRMRRVEELILSKAPGVYNALRPEGTPALPEPDFVISVEPTRPTRAKPRTATS